jgi:hypothetical protein
MALKNFANPIPMELNDILHRDGSKSYRHFSGSYITIKRPEVVELIEKILAGGHLGWSYMTIVDKHLKEGFIDNEEYRMILAILD